ncbi:DUF2470 domain-containing protein [Agrococcus sp. Ld7]|uniref:DUF2470 domain-containing protein n=1 Tax=Agrococcus sp. Ld7 TaxID=649148 RepID=UPI00386349A0
MAIDFTADVVQAVVTHMNGDHLDDQLAIVRAHARPGATSATLATIGEGGLTFDVRTDRDAAPERVTVPWPMPIDERVDIRRAVVMLMPRA